MYRGILFPKKYRAKFSYLPFKHSNNAMVDGATALPGIEESLPEEWVTIEDDFKVFWASNVSHPSYNVHLSPKSKMNDGIFHIIVVR